MPGSPALFVDGGDLGWVFTLDAAGGADGPVWVATTPVIDRNDYYTGEDAREERPLEALATLLVQLQGNLNVDWRFGRGDLDTALGLASDLVREMVPLVGLEFVDGLSVHGQEGDGTVPGWHSSGREAAEAVATPTTSHPHGSASYVAAVTGEEVNPVSARRAVRSGPLTNPSLAARPASSNVRPSSSRTWAHVRCSVESEAQRKDSAGLPFAVRTRWAPCGQREQVAMWVPTGWAGSPMASPREP